MRSWDYSRDREWAHDRKYPPVDVLSPLFTDFLDDLYERQNVLSRCLMVAFAEMWGLPPDTFVAHFDNGGDMGTIRLLYYPPKDGTNLQPDDLKSLHTGIAAHTDFEAFTLMHQDAPGLQFLRPGSTSGDEWEDAPVRKGEFVVIVGDVLERFTNGQLKATPHRVIQTGEGRRSIIRFNAVAPSTTIAPLEAFVTLESPAKYSPVTMQHHMDATISALERGEGSWDSVRNVSTSATRHYDA